MSRTAMTEAELKEAIKDAMFRGDTSRLHELAPCSCCCEEHYHLPCPAHAWMGCRGSYAADRTERERMERIFGSVPMQARIKAEDKTFSEWAGFDGTGWDNSIQASLGPDGPKLDPIGPDVDETDLQG
ncbi:hypothetical protein [Myxococcus phage Mx1]|nr:hypothetical protein [Myxococcus phage Mx1]